MSQKRVSLYLKVPKRPVNLLHQLENSILESMVEYKPIDPHTGSPLDESQGGASYQIKGTADVVDGELLIRFNARQAGLHTARIFANTKEVCRQVAFFVKSSGEVESVQLPMGGEQLLDSGLASGASTVRGAETKPAITSPPPYRSVLKITEKNYDKLFFISIIVFLIHRLSFNPLKLFPPPSSKAVIHLRSCMMNRWAQLGTMLVSSLVVHLVLRLSNC